MSAIDPALLTKLMKALDVGRSRVYARIDDAARTTSLPKSVAALWLAREAGVNFSRFASAEDLAMLRAVGAPAPFQVATARIAPSPASVAPAARSSRKATTRAKKKENQVFVVHGRNDKIRQALFAFLRSVGVQPIEWNKALTMTKKGSPYVGEVIDAAFDQARAIIVLFTPDDEAKLKKEFITKSDPTYEKKYTGQPRPNVFFEAGMAFGRHPTRTILVQVGKIRPVSDIAGRHMTHLTNSMTSRQQFIAKLKAAGLDVDTIGDSWHTEGDFK